MSSSPSFRDGLAQSLPIAIGYFPIAFSFGVATTKAGFSAFEAVFLSLVVYAGAAQFVALALLASASPAIVTILTLLAMNLRHLLYGPSLLEKAREQARTRFSWAWAFGLTDEVFAAAIGTLARQPGRWSEPFMLGLGLGAYAAWVLGTGVGASLGGGALEAWPAVDAALGFMLPALFLSLLLSILTRPQIPVILTAGLVCVLVTVLISTTWGILAGMIGGASAGLVNLERRRVSQR